MNITEMISKLEELRDKHGDLPCYGYHQTFGLARVYPIERFSADIDKEYGELLYGNFQNIGALCHDRHLRSFRNECNEAD